MSDVMSPVKEEERVTPEEILAFLKDNPNFVEENPEAIELLIPKRKRPKKGDVADFQSYMIERLKTDKEEALEGLQGNRRHVPRQYEQPAAHPRCRAAPARIQ